MAKKDKKDIALKELNTTELTQRLEKTREELFKVRFRAASAPVKDTMAIRRMRREVARLNTFINQKTVEQNGSVNQENRGNVRGKK